MAKACPGVAGAAVLFLGWIFWSSRKSAVGSGGNPGVAFFAFFVLVFVAVFWVVPLTVGSVAVLRGRQYGWWILTVCGWLGGLGHMR